jgi:hypothetical protein
MEPITRDDLIQEVHYGRMTPDDAEAEAARLGLGKLSCQPDDGTFDPMGETWWTLTMAVAWIAWRTPKLVRAYWPAFRQECWDWHYRDWRLGFDGPIHSGHFLEQRREANLNTLVLNESYDAAHGLLPPNSINVRQAQEKLWDALSKGSLEGYGKDIETGERTLIPAIRWRDLKAYVERERDVLRADPMSRMGYNSIEFRRQAIMATWPPHGREEWDTKLPPTVAPEGPGYMSLYCAAQWIATKGGSLEFDPRDTANWQGPYAELLARIASSEVTVTGVRDGVGERLDPDLFASLRVGYPFSAESVDLIISDELYLSSCAYINDEHWRQGFDDHLRGPRGVQWSRIQVLRSDVARWWSFSEDTATAVASYRTGAPGRPTSMQLVVREHAARWERGDALESIVAESEVLSRWLRETHPAAPKLSPKTIRNNLATVHRQRVAARK